MQVDEFLIELHGENSFLSHAEREDFEERAAIIEFDAGYERKYAEILAFEAILRSRASYKEAI